jgi:hypothetical protein
MTESVLTFTKIDQSTTFVRGLHTPNRKEEKEKPFDYPPQKEGVLAAEGTG